MRQWHNHKASPFDLQPLEWILNLEDTLHSLQHLKTEVRNFAFFCDLSTATTKYLRLWRPALHSKSILKASIQMVRLCDYATVFFSCLHIDFLTFLALLRGTF